MEIKYIELMLSDFTLYKIDKSNILECNCVIKDEYVDCDAFEEEENDNVPLVESLLLVIDDYTKILSYDTEKEFDVNRKDIAQIAIYKEDDSIEMGYVNLTSENKNQLNYLTDNRLFITIEE